MELIIQKTVNCTVLSGTLTYLSVPFRSGCPTTPVRSLNTTADSSQHETEMVRVII